MGMARAAPKGVGVARPTPSADMIESKGYGYGKGGSNY